MILRNKSVYVLKIHTTPGRIDLEYRTFKSNKNNRNKIKDSKNTFFYGKLPIMELFIQEVMRTDVLWYLKSILIISRV